MKKIILAALLIVGFGGYALWNMRNATAAPLAAPSESSSQPLANRPLIAPKSASFIDGAYTGAATGSIYGIIQVAAVIRAGKLSDVQFLQFPSDRAHSIEVSNYSLPILRSEAIAAQSAEVDIVSGATQTSEAFRESLVSALRKARS